MSLQINAALTTKDGGSVASGAHVKFQAYFPQADTKYSVTMNVWRSEQAYIDGLQPIRGVQEIPSLSYTKEMEMSEFSGITPTSIHQDLKVYLEGFVGSGNVDIIL